MADLEQKVHEMEASTFDGVFIWKIPDFARKRQDAVAGRTPAIFSPGALPELALPLSCCHPGPPHPRAGVCPLPRPGAAGSPGGACPASRLVTPQSPASCQGHVSFLKRQPHHVRGHPSAPRWT